MSRTAQIHLEEQLRNIVRYFRREYHVTLGDVIGTLEVMKLELYREITEEAEAEEEEGGEYGRQSE